MSETQIDRRRDRKADIRARFDRLAADRARWIERNAYFHETDRDYMRFLVPPGRRVIEIGSGAGDLLAGLEPSRGVGVDISPAMVAAARARHPGLEFHAGDVEDPDFVASIEGPFDAIVLSGSVGFLEDAQASFALFQRWCTPSTRIVVSYHSWLWEPALQIAERLGAKMPEGMQNWLTTRDIMNLFDLAGFETVRREWRQLLPRRLGGLGPLVNRYVAPCRGCDACACATTSSRGRGCDATRVRRRRRPAW